MTKEKQEQEVGPGMQLLGVVAVLCLGVVSKANTLAKSVFEGQTPEEVAESYSKGANESPFWFWFSLLLFIGFVVLVCKFLFWVFVSTGAFFF